ncbi:hypothetical protein ACFL67_03635 [candidate division KSB1 bacterium]
MRFKIFMFIIVITFFHCTEKGDPELSKIDIERLREFRNSNEKITLDNIIGSEETVQNNDFLLAQPRIALVNEKNDVIIADEGRIKVFDALGKEKLIFGNIGQGPGEFYQNFIAFLSPEGYLSVMDVDAGAYGSECNGRARFIRYYNIFSPDYSFIEKRRFDSSEALTDYLLSSGAEINLLTGTAYLRNERKPDTFIRRFYLISENELLYALTYDITDQQNIIIPIYDIVYEKEGKIMSLCKSRNPAHTKLIGTSYPLGEVKWEVLPDNRIVCLNTDNDVVDPADKSFYSLQIISFKDRNSIKTIRRPYTPIRFPERMIEVKDVPGMTDDIRKREELRKKPYKDKGYYVSAVQLLSDNKFIFVFLYSKGYEKGSGGDPFIPLTTDVFDAENGEYVSTVDFPFIPWVIRNGYAYNLTVDADYFPVVEKYRIDPAVYGK